jgi:hypothetical integral membrane protein (TIGR02206 family)
MNHAFIPFGPAHKAAIALTFAVPLVLAALTRLSGSKSFERIAHWSFAVLLLATYVLWYWMLIGRGWASPGNVLPMWLCDWAAILCIVTAFHPGQKTFELAYFWALIGTLQALFTPELAYDFPDLRFVVFFAFHGLVVAAVIYMTLGMRMRPVPASIPRTIGWTLFYTACAGAVDWYFGVNFAYLRAKPYNPSLLDYLSPWPWYIAELVPIGIVLIMVLYSPFFIADRLRGKPAG